MIPISRLIHKNFILRFIFFKIHSTRKNIEAIEVQSYKKECYKKTKKFKSSIIKILFLKPLNIYDTLNCGIKTGKMIF